MSLIVFNLTLQPWFSFVSTTRYFGTAQLRQQEALLSSPIVERTSEDQIGHGEGILSLKDQVRVPGLWIHKSGKREII